MTATNNAMNDLTLIDDADLDAVAGGGWGKALGSAIGTAVGAGIVTLCGAATGGVAFAASAVVVGGMAEVGANVGSWAES